MNIDTTRFGKIEIRETELIVMKGSILGFENLNCFVLLSHNEKTPLWWLQSIDDPAVAFVVADPWLLKPDYNPTIPEDEIKFLEMENNDDIALLVIATVRSDPFRVTANLRAPILINAANRMATQVVLEHPDYPIQYDVIDNKADSETSLSAECRKTVGLGKIPLTVAAS